MSVTALTVCFASAYCLLHSRSSFAPVLEFLHGNGSTETRCAAAVSAVSAVFALGIALRKLYHAPAFDALRSTRMGRRIIGCAFSVDNLLCCGIGLALAASLKYIWFSARTKTEIAPRLRKEKGRDKFM